MWLWRLRWQNSFLRCKGSANEQPDQFEKTSPQRGRDKPAQGLKTEPAPWLDKNGKPIELYAGKQWDSDIGDAKKALADLEKHCPGSKGSEVAGFFFRQGERDAGNAGHAAHYEKNLV